MLTDAQIQAMFRYCKDVNEQVTICSQLTGKSEAEICGIVGIDPVKRVKKPKPREQYKPWTDEETEHLITAFKCGIKKKRIADMLDRTLPAVRTKIHDLIVKGVLSDE